MFKSTYIPSKVTKTWRDFVHDENSILKNANLVFIDDDGEMHFMEGWPPEHALGEGDDPDHPALAYNPLTGELIEGHHPVDAVAKDLLEAAHAAGRTDITMHDITRHEGVMDAIFNHHNKQQPEGSHHKLSPFAHPSWRKNVVGGYPEGGKLDARTHQVRGRRNTDGSLGMKQNYSYKHGTPDVAAADRGQSIDAGLFVPYESARLILDAINKREYSKGLPAPFPDIDKYYFTQSAKVPISKLTNGRVIALSQGEQKALMGGTMHPNVRNRLGVPAAMEDSITHKDLHPSRMLRMMPDWMFVPTAKGRKGSKDNSDKMAEALEMEGVKHDISDPATLSTLWKTPAIQASYHRAGTTGGRYKEGMRRMFQHFGITPGDDSHHDKSRRRMGGTTRSNVGQGVRGAELATLYRGLSVKLMAEGHPQDKAVKMAEEMIRNYEDSTLDAKYSPDHRALVEPLLTGIRDAKGWKPFDLSETGIDTSEMAPVFQNAPVTSQAPSHMQSRILTSANLAPPGNEPHPPAQPEEPVRPRLQLPIPGRTPVEAPTAPAPPIPMATSPPPPSSPQASPPQIPMATKEDLWWNIDWSDNKLAMLKKAAVEMQYDITGKPVYVVGGPGGHRAPPTRRGKIGREIGRALGAFGGLAAGGRSLGQVASNVYFGGQQGARAGQGLGQWLSTRRQKAEAAEKENVHMAFARAQAQGLIPFGTKASMDEKRQMLGQISEKQSQQQEAAKLARAQRGWEAKEKFEAGVRGTKTKERLAEQEQRLANKLAHEKKKYEAKALARQNEARAAAAGTQTGERMQRPPTIPMATTAPPPTASPLLGANAKGMPVPPLQHASGAQPELEINDQGDLPPELIDHNRGVTEIDPSELPELGGKPIDDSFDKIKALAEQSKGGAVI